MGRVILVRLEYGLTLDQAQADAIDRVLVGCEPVEMAVLAPTNIGVSQTTAPHPNPAADMDSPAKYNDNGNVRVTCAEARARGIAPVHRGHPAHEYMNGRDGDGVVCE